MSAQRDHGLNRKTHSWLRFPNCLVLRVVRHVRDGVKQLIDTMATVCLHNRAVVGFGNFLDRVTVIPEECAWLDLFDGLVQRIAGGFHDPNVVRILSSGRADVVGLIQVAMEATVIERYVDVENVAVHEGSVVGNAVADNFVDARANGFREMAVIEW